MSRTRRFLRYLKSLLRYLKLLRLSKGSSSTNDATSLPELPPHTIFIHGNSERSLSPIRTNLISDGTLFSDGSCTTGGTTPSKTKRIAKGRVKTPTMTRSSSWRQYLAAVLLLSMALAAGKLRL